MDTTSSSSSGDDDFVILHPVRVRSGDTISRTRMITANSRQSGRDLHETSSSDADSSIIVFSEHDSDRASTSSSRTRATARDRPNTIARLRNIQRRTTIHERSSHINRNVISSAGPSFLSSRATLSSRSLAANRATLASRSLAATSRSLAQSRSLAASRSLASRSPESPSPESPASPQNNDADTVEMIEIPEAEITDVDERARVIEALTQLLINAYRHLNPANNYLLNSNGSNINSRNRNSLLRRPFRSILEQINVLPMSESSRLSEFAQIVIQNEAIDDLNSSSSESVNINASENAEGQSLEPNIGRNNEGPSVGNNYGEGRTESNPNLATMQAQLRTLQRSLHDVENHFSMRLPGQPPLYPSEDVNLPSTSAGHLDTSVEIIEIEEDEAEITTDINSSSCKKRKRSKNDSLNLAEEEDDGSTCPICLDHWDLCGAHRLSSLKCGHLFGDSCIRRWLNECPQGAKVCPSCKAKVGTRDIRYIYAKRIRMVDNSEEVRLREQVELAKTKYTGLQMNYELLSFELKTVKTQVTKLEEDIERMSRIQHTALGQALPTDKTKLYHIDYKMFLSKSITITQDPTCRVLIHSKRNHNLIISQKSSQSLFNGYGVKFIDVQENFRPTNFLYTSHKNIRDLSLSADDALISCASMEPIAKIFDIRTRQSTVSLTLPTNQAIWSCAFDKEFRSNTIYLGSQHGSTYVYDIRNRNQIIDEQSVEGDTSPVIQILPVPISNMFPYGGFWVCKLQSLWFYEILSTQAVNATRIGIEGPFMSINYNDTTGNMLISTRNCTKFPMSKYILGKIMKVDDAIIWETEMNLFGSKITPIMTRCTQISLPDNNSLIAAYIQDAKQLTLWNVGKGLKIQSLPCSDVVYDTCPVKICDKTYMAASTDMKCRIYEVLPSEKY